MARVEKNPSRSLPVGFRDAIPLLDSGKDRKCSCIHLKDEPISVFRVLRLQEAATVEFDIDQEFKTRFDKEEEKWYGSIIRVILL